MVLFFVFHNIAFKNVFKRLKESTPNRFGFYECGLRMRKTGNITFTLFFYNICIFTLLYELEGFLFIFLLLNISVVNLSDFILIASFVLFFIFGFIVDLKNHAFTWNFY